METQEIIDLATSLTDHYVPLVDAQQAELIRMDMSVGEWENAVSNLTACLAKQQIPVSEQDSADLRRLHEALDSPFDFVDQLIVQE